jgi:hypothetical protein
VDGEGWAKVVLHQTGPAEYAGTYTDTFGKEPGTIELKWSRIERRYNGTWNEGKERFGKISVRQVGDQIRGAWTTSRNSTINPGTPKLGMTAGLFTLSLIGKTSWSLLAATLTSAPASRRAGWAATSA